LRKLKLISERGAVSCAPSVAVKPRLGQLLTLCDLPVKTPQSLNALYLLPKATRANVHQLTHLTQLMHPRAALPALRAGEVICTKGVKTDSLFTRFPSRGKVYNIPMAEIYATAKSKAHSTGVLKFLSEPFSPLRAATASRPLLFSLVPYHRFVVSAISVFPTPAPCPHPLFPAYRPCSL